MKLVKNWRRIAARSHSMRAFYLLLALWLFRDVSYFVWGRDVASPLFYYVGIIAIIVYGVWGRLRPQGIDHD